jgi:hypothetical protein
MYNDNMDTSEFSMRRGYNWNISNDKSMAYDSTMGHNRTSSSGSKEALVFGKKLFIFSGTNIVYRVSLYI